MTLVPLKGWIHSQFCGGLIKEDAVCISKIITCDTSKEFKANQLHSFVKTQMLVGIIGFQVSVLIGYHLNINQASCRNILFIILLIDSILLAFCSPLSMVSRTVNMTLQATSGILHLIPFYLLSLSLSLSLPHPSCRTPVP